MPADLELIQADWPAPARVHALTTTRCGGVSRGAYQGLNLASHVADEPAQVVRNRELLASALSLPAEPLWLNQIHSTRVLAAPALSLDSAGDLTADAAWSDQPGRVCAVLTADCLPLLFCDRAATRVASSHAGWRGLLAGVIRSTVAALGPADQLMVWLGPAIGAEAFEVGAEVFTAFRDKHPDYAQAFRQTDTRHWLCDVYALARIELQQLGLSHIYGGGLCTLSDARRFYSYRRDGVTGRMASLIWLE